MEMNIDNYQSNAVKTAVYPDTARYHYPAMGLAGEAGEVTNKLKKVMRGDTTLDDIKEDLLHEIGDVLWYIAALCNDLETPMSTVAQLNLDKLNGRLEKNVLGGKKMRDKMLEQQALIDHLKAKTERLEEQISFSLRLP